MNNIVREIRTSKYEILCIIKEIDKEKKEPLINSIEKIINPEKVKFSSEIKKLAYRIEDLESADYTLLNFEAKRDDISSVEEIIKNSFIVRYMIINLDTEKKFKLSKLLKKQEGKKANFEKFTNKRFDRNKKSAEFEKRNYKNSPSLKNNESK